MSKSKLIEEAMADAEKLREAAIQNAQNVLAESMKKKIKEMVDSQLGESEFTLEAGGESGEEDFELPELEPEEGEDEKEKKEEVFMPEDLEMEMTDPMTEAEDEEEKEEEEEEVDEVVEITGEDLEKALSEVLGDLKEASVTKSFGDVEDPTPKTAGGKQQTGIADEKSGESQWVDETPPDAEDWTVKEGKYRKLVRSLNSQLKEYKSACLFLRDKINEVNLFNNKLLYTNRVLQSNNLNDNQKMNVVEMFDRAKSMRDVQLVYKTLSESFKIAGVVSESKRKRQRSSGYTTSSSKNLLKESLDNSNSQESWADKQKRLAGIVK